MKRPEVAVGPVHDSASFGDDPHVQARGVLVEMEDAEFCSIPIHTVCPRLHRTPGALRRLAPELGELNSEISSSMLLGIFEKCPKKLWLGACTRIATDPQSVDGQNVEKWCWSSTSFTQISVSTNLFQCRKRSTIGKRPSEAKSRSGVNDA